MYAVKRVADIAGIAPSTVRNWGEILAPVLSDSANPPRGQERIYTDDDILVLHTAKVLRRQKKSWDDVIAIIKAGDLIIPAAPQKGVKSDEAGSQPGPGGLMAADEWDRYTAPFKDLISTLKEQLTKAEERAEVEVKAKQEETALRIRVEERIKVETAARVEAEEELDRLRNRSLWDRMRNR